MDATHAIEIKNKLPKARTEKCWQEASTSTSSQIDSLLYILNYQGKKTKVEYAEAVLGFEKIIDLIERQERLAKLGDAALKAATNNELCEYNYGDALCSSADCGRRMAMTLDKAISQGEVLLMEATVNHKAQIELTRQIQEWLAELRTRRESDLRPATKLLTNTPIQQFRHIAQEFSEVSQAVYEYSTCQEDEQFDHLRNRAIKELVDLQTSCEIMLAVLGLDEQQRQEARRMVIKKNDSRGYYNSEEVSHGTASHSQTENRNRE